MKVLSAALALVCGLFVWSIPDTAAQGVTTASITGVVRDAQGGLVPGATVVAVHQPSGTSYEGVSQGDGRFFIPGMRVGGPYKVTASLSGFTPESKDNITLSLGVAQDVDFALQVAALAETVEVVGTADPVFASSRTGAATAISREEIADLPTISGRINDITRLTPQARGNSFSGQDDRQNNITVDGSYFNSAFGLGEGQPGGRTGVAPISLESIEQVQVSVAPYDVRQGNFIGAAVNTVTRSGTNALSASVYHRFRNQDYVGTEARGLAVNPGTFTFKNTGVYGGGPIVKNRLFVFGNFENEKDTRPLHTFVANTGGQPVGGSITRVLASDLDALSAYLKQNFKYDTGGYQNIPAETPAKRYLLRTDYNLNTSNKVNFRYNQLDSSSAKNLSGSSSVGFGRGTFGTSFLNFASSNYAQLENIKSGISEWNSVLGTSISQSLIVGYTTNNEDRGPIQLFPFVDILAPDGTAYTSLGSEPFTPSNALQYQTFQIKDDFTKFSAKHSWTVGGTMQRYHQINVFAPLLQSAYVYNSLQDFYTDANGFLANPNRTTSPVTLRRFQVRYNNIPGQTEPVQPMMVYYSGGYAQDEFRPRTNMTIIGGVRFDVANFTSKGFPNPNADALVFRDERGNSVQYSSGHLPDPKVLWSPRVALNWDVAGQQTTQVRVGTGVFTGPPLYVWISNQIGNTGVLTGFDQFDNVTNRPFNPNVDTYKPAHITGAPAASYELDITDNSFKFPQVWRTNLAVDRRLPGGVTSTTEYIYNRDINGIYYINSNLPAPSTAFTGADTRARYTASRIYNAAPNVITAAIVMKNQSVGRSWNISETLSKTLYHGLTLRGSYSYGDAKNTIDPGSTAFSSWQLNQTPNDPNNPGLGRSKSAQGHRVFVQSSYTRSYFGFGATTISAFWEARASLNGNSYSSTASYVFAGDMNGDGAAGNDLIYIPRNVSEMNFVDIPATATNRAFTAAEQAAAFEAYIQQDEYLSKHRGQYAERGGILYPMAKRMDLSIVQDVFHDIGGKRNAGQFRIDFTNFGNLLNHNWGVSQRLVVPTTQAEGAQILTNPGVDAQGRSTYRLALANGQLVSKTFQPNTNLFSDTRGSDVYQFMLSFRYSFN